ncbi:tRNA-dihydrouridine(47) synthase [NAD(P)(+)]-like [Sesamum alatum]|uniref:tRNA-dihydrouridine(47) synthase [NAD(P)(+)]-like n=1 Tax=Sesamum alatum TaxID=300844 RepID=A0AAE1YWQ6_9LAMI|nr:tRNA-dihydrouridine(47) synthase [NAD(P)(+)]-like [Sesamum alatum]
MLGPTTKSRFTFPYHDLQFNSSYVGLLPCTFNCHYQFPLTTPQKPYLDPQWQTRYSWNHTLNGVSATEPSADRTNDGNNSSKADEGAAAQKDGTSAPILKEKKSKRQLKRERRQEQKSALHICPEVAKSGKASSCLYGDKCRYSHDLESIQNSGRLKSEKK